MIYAPTRVKPLTAIRAGGSGDITATHVAWRWDKQTGPDVPAPLCDGTFFYMVDDRGTATCLNAKTGDVIWGPEKTVAGAVSSSPLLADGNIYITNEKGITTVLKAGSAFAKLAENTLPSEGQTLASMAVAGKSLFYRSPTYLYRIEQKGK